MDNPFKHHSRHHGCEFWRRRRNLSDRRGAYPLPASNTPRTLGWIATGDFNGDGIPDLIVTDVTVVDSPVLDLFTGKGDGTFNNPYH